MGSEYDSVAEKIALKEKLAKLTFNRISNPPSLMHINTWELTDNALPTRKEKSDRVIFRRNDPNGRVSNVNEGEQIDKRGFEMEELWLGLLAGEIDEQGKYAVHYRHTSNMGQETTIVMSKQCCETLFKDVLMPGFGLNVQDVQEIFTAVEREAQASGRARKFKTGIYAAMKEKVGVHEERESGKEISKRLIREAVAERDQLLSADFVGGRTVQDWDSQMTITTYPEQGMIDIQDKVTEGEHYLGYTYFRAEQFIKAILLAGSDVSLVRADDLKIRIRYKDVRPEVLAFDLETSFPKAAEIFLACASTLGLSKEDAVTMLQQFYVGVVLKCPEVEFTKYYQNNATNWLRKEILSPQEAREARRNYSKAGRQQTEPQEERDNDEVQRKKKDLFRQTVRNRWWEMQVRASANIFSAGTMDHFQVIPSEKDKKVHLIEARGKNLAFDPAHLITGLLSSKSQEELDDVFVSMPYQAEAGEVFCVYEIRMPQALKMLISAGEMMGLNVNDLIQLANEVYDKRSQMTSVQDAWQCLELANGLGSYKHGGGVGYKNTVFHGFAGEGAESQSPPPRPGSFQSESAPSAPKEAPPRNISKHTEAIQFLLEIGAISNSFSSLSEDEQKALTRGLRRSEMYRNLHAKVDKLRRTSPESEEFKNLSEREALFNRACAVLTGGAVNKG